MINHYPDAIIEEAARSSGGPRRRRFVNTKSAFIKLPYKSDKVHHKVKNIIRKYNIPTRIVYEHTGSLTNILCRSALSRQPCKSTPIPAGVRGRGRPRGPCIACMSGAGEGICVQKNAVYKLRCRICGQYYVGETGCHLEKRLREHRDDAKNRAANTPWGIHFIRHHQDTQLGTNESPFSDVRVLAREADRAKRRLREAVEIQHHKPQINITKGWDLI